MFRQSRTAGTGICDLVGTGGFRRIPSDTAACRIVLGTECSRTSGCNTRQELWSLSEPTIDLLSAILIVCSRASAANVFFAAWDDRDGIEREQFVGVFGFAVGVCSVTTRDIPKAECFRAIAILGLILVATP